MVISTVANMTSITFTRTITFVCAYLCVLVLAGRNFYEILGIDKRKWPQAGEHVDFVESV